MNSLAELRKELQKCMKCGNCQAVCPLYREMAQEAACARGKISLVQAVLDGDLPLSAGFAKRVDLCLLCGACAANCPNGVAVTDIMIAARAAIKQERGLPAAKRLAFAALQHQTLLDLGLTAGRHLQGIPFHRQPGAGSMHARLPIGQGGRRLVPALADRSLRQVLPEVISVDRPRLRVAFFTGCTINYAYTGIGQAVVRVLAENNIEVVLPAGQQCCGMPIYTSGDLDATRVLARANLEALGDGVDAVVTACASCGSALKREYPALLADDSRFAERARLLSAKVYDISEFLIDQIELQRDRLHPVELRVTYHDPCHLNRAQGVSRQPREIIRAVPGIEFRELANPGCCCGAAGSFTLTHYDLSMVVQQRKMEEIGDTGADAVITGCPACRMQLEDGLHRTGMGLQVLHTVELLDLAYRGA